MGETRRTRGKQKIDPALREFHMQRIESTRNALWSAKTVFEERKRQEWAELKATLERDTYEAVWKARDANLIIDDIKHAYGVSNASVIYNVLRARPQDEAEATAPGTNEPEPATEPYTWEVSTDPAGYTCTENQSGARAYVDAKGTPVSAEGKTLDGKTMAMLLFNPAHEAWATYPGTRA